MVAISNQTSNARVGRIGVCCRNKVAHHPKFIQNSVRCGLSFLFRKNHLYGEELRVRILRLANVGRSFFDHDRLQ